MLAHLKIIFFFFTVVFFVVFVFLTIHAPILCQRHLFKLSAKTNSHCTPDTSQVQPFQHKSGKTLVQSWSLDSGLLLRPFIPSLIWLWSSQSLVGLKMTLKSSQFFLGYLDTNTLNSTRAPFSYSLRASKLGIDAKDFFMDVCLFVLKHLTFLPATNCLLKSARRLL